MLVQILVIFFHISQACSSDCCYHSQSWVPSIGPSARSANTGDFARTYTIQVDTPFATGAMTTWNGVVPPMHQIIGGAQYKLRPPLSSIYACFPIKVGRWFSTLSPSWSKPIAMMMRSATAQPFSACEHSMQPSRDVISVGSGKEHCRCSKRIFHVMCSQKTCSML